MDADTLDGLKYRDLQKVAKDLGLKANGNKKGLVQAILEQRSSDEDSGDLDNLEIDLVPLEESQLDVTFEVDESKQNILNETFEKEAAENISLDDSDVISFPKEETEEVERRSRSNSKFVEFSVKESSPIDVEQGGMTLVTSSNSVNKPLRKSSVSNPPSSDYLSKKNRTPLRGVSKTPGSIVKNDSNKAVKKCEAKSKLPRFVEFARSRNPKVGKMPDFAKMHEMNFKKMESLSDTVTKQLDRAKALTNDHNEIVKKMNDRKTPGKTPAGNASNKQTLAPFVPSVLTTSKMNLDFTAVDQSSKPATEPFQFTAKSKVGQMTTRVAPRPRQEVKVATVNRKKFGGDARFGLGVGGTHSVLGNITNKSINKSVGGTPGKKFDIKASLARPLNYIPHKGKLAPLAGGKVKEKKEGELSFQETKQRQMTVIKGVRLNKRAELMMKNRQIDN